MKSLFPVLAAIMVVSASTSDTKAASVALFDASASFSVDIAAPGAIVTVSDPIVSSPDPLQFGLAESTRTATIDSTDDPFPIEGAASVEGSAMGLIGHTEPDASSSMTIDFLNTTMSPIDVALNFTLIANAITFLFVDPGPAISTASASAAINLDGEIIAELSVSVVDGDVLTPDALVGSFVFELAVATTAQMLLSADVFGVADVNEPAPVPLPTALPVFGTGLGLMGLFGWWRRREDTEAAV